MSTQDQAVRALAKCTYYTIVVGAGTLGAVFGGPVGAAIGAAFATPLAIVAESAIAQNIDNDEMRKKYAEISVERFITETLINGLAFGAGAYVGAVIGTWVGAQVGAAGYEALVSAASFLSGRTGNLITREALTEYVNILACETKLTLWVLLTGCSRRFEMCSRTN